MTQDSRRGVEALTRSSRQLAAVTGQMLPGGLGGPTFCTRWSVAQVLSHLGSGAEIFDGIVEAALAGKVPPGPDTFPAVWERWNALEPEQQARAALDADGRLAERFGGLTGDELAVPLDLFGLHVTVGALAGWRVVEIALHTWDIAVISDPATTLDAMVADAALEAVTGLASRAGKSAGFTGRWLIETSGTRPRLFELDCADQVTLSERAGGGSAEGGVPAVPASMPAESLVRLVAGRLPPASTPPDVDAAAGVLDRLREVFPGY